MESVRRSGGQSGAIPMAMVLGALDLFPGKPASAHQLLSEPREASIANGWGLVGAMSLSRWTADVEALTALGRVERADRRIAPQRTLPPLRGAETNAARCSVQSGHARSGTRERRAVRSSPPCGANAVTEPVQTRVGGGSRRESTDGRALAG